MKFEYEDITFRAISSKDHEFLYNMRMNKNITDNLFSCMPYSYEEHVKNLEKMQNDPTKKYLMVFLNDEKPVGLFRIVDIDYRSRKAEVGGDIVMCEQGKGYGKKMWATGIAFCTQELNLRKLYLYVFVFNKKAKKIYNIIGFKETGLMEKHVYRNGQYHDVSYMEYFKDNKDCEHKDEK